MQPDPLRDASPDRGDVLEPLSRAFERVGAWSFDHRWLVLAVCGVLLVVCAQLASRARVDNSLEAYFDRADPTYAAYNRFREDFGSDEVSYILYEAPGRPDGPFDLEVMRSIARLTRQLEEQVPFVSEVTSLANAEYVEGVPDGLEIYELLEEFPGSREEMLAIRDKVLAKPLYVGGLVSRDAAHAAIIIETERSSVDPLEEIRLDPDGGDGLENLYPQVTYHAIEKILAEPGYEGIRFHHVGDVPLNAVFNEVVGEDTGRLGAAAALAIGGLLFFFFRHPIGVIGPMAVVGLSIMVSMACIGLFGWSMDLMFMMCPTLLIAVGVADAVHILAEFRAYHAELGDRREAARRTLRLVGPPCLLTSLTTAAGFLSMSVAPIKSISHFAIYAAIGVVAAFLLSVTLLFVALSFGRQRPRGALETERARAKGGRRIHGLLAAIARFDLRRRREILVFFGGLFVFSAAGIAQIRVDSNFLYQFDESEPVRRSTHYVDDIMGGTYSFVYLFDSGEAEGMKEPAVLHEMERLRAAAEREVLVRKTYSIGDLLKDLNRSFHAEDPAFYALPETRELAAQYLLLYEMSGGDELGDYVSSDFARASLELRCKAVETSELARMAASLDDFLGANPVTASSVSVTGIGALWLELETYITRSQIRGFLLAFGVIAALMCAIFRSIRTGLIAMIPNLSPVVLTLGAMGWLDVPLDSVRLLIASVAIGISVDDTIHHMLRFRHEFRRRGRYDRALEASMTDVGRALFITSVVLVVGFLMFLASGMDSLDSFGALLATTIATALLADFVLMPALVLSLQPFGPETPQRAAPTG